MLNVVNVSDLSVVSELQLSEAWVDVNCQDELDNIRLALSRALGEAEPVLYIDEEEDDVVYSDDSNEEKELNMIIDIQERMATGMKMIQECNSVIELAKSGKRRLPYEVFCSWISRRRKLWSHWKQLASECREIIGDRVHLWGKYFELRDSVIDCTGYSDDLDLSYVYAIDDQKVLWLESSDILDDGFVE